MTSNILVAFATKHGGTTGIAEAIGRTLRESAGLQVGVRPAAEVRDLADYQAVIVGSAVYMGNWQKDALDFLKRFERELRERPVWLFSSGPIGGTPEADATVSRATASPDVIAAPDEIAERARHIAARGHATFGGRVGDEMNGLLERWLPRGDWRDFDVVTAWARSVAHELRAESPAGQGAGGHCGPETEGGIS
jgi:menaquinone-dependent protoporphyrinogen oxidase